MKYSTEYVAQLAILVGFVLQLFKVEIASEELQMLINAVLVVGGSVYALYKRYKKGDVTPLGFRK